MLIKSVSIKKLRSIREATLNCDDLTAIVGRNGVGKSSLLYALDFFYDVAAPITNEDFFSRNTSSPIEIQVTYSDLRDDEKLEFKSFIKHEELIVTKRISVENDRIIQRYFAAAAQIPQFAQIRAISKKSDRISSWKNLVSRRELPDLDEKLRNADKIEQYMRKYEDNHPDFMEPIEREEEFFGPRNIGGGKLDKFTKFVLVPAVREASDEVTGKKGAVYQILDMIVLRRVNAREDIQQFRSKFEDNVKILYSSENLKELPELGVSISQTLEKFAPGCKLNLKWDDVTPPQIPLPEAKATLIEDSFEGEIKHKGHGLQRALILTLLQHLAVTTPLQTTLEETDVAEPKISEPSAGPDLILAIEEPELYLHPSRCRHLADLLLQLTRKPEIGLGGKNQVIYTTHSPYFIDLHRFDQIRMVRKQPSANSPIPQSVVTQFSLRQAANKLAEVCNADPARFTRDSFKARAISVMNTIVNEGFFGDVVLVVEGASEVGAFWKLQEIMTKNWAQLGIALVPAGGKNNLDRPVIIFRGLSIPTYFVFDADSHLLGQRKKEKEAKKRNHRYLCLAGAPMEDFPDTQVHDNWAVFKNNLEGILKEGLGTENFQSVQKVAASELGFDDAGRILKNIEGAASFIEMVYERNHRIPVLENIVEKVTQLRSNRTS